MLCYGGLVFILLAYFVEGFDHKRRKNVQKTAFKGSSYRIPKAKKLLFG